MRTVIFDAITNLFPTRLFQELRTLFRYFTITQRGIPTLGEGPRKGRHQSRSGWETHRCGERSRRGLAAGFSSSAAEWQIHKMLWSSDGMLFFDPWLTVDGNMSCANSFGVSGLRQI
jgi:hypothetical protein